MTASRLRRPTIGSCTSSIPRRASSTATTPPSLSVATTGKVKIVKKHETPTRVGGVLGGGVGLATGLVVALFAFAAVGGGLLVGTAAGGAVLGAVAGHAAAGMSRHDLKELGEHLDTGTAGLVVVAVSDMGAKVEQAMKRAAKLEQKELKADTAEIERDAASATEGKG